MVKGVKLIRQLEITVVNKIGILAGISALLSESGINIEAVAGYAVNNDARIMLITESNARAIDLLKKAGYASIRENEVVVVDLENKPGALKLITSKLASQNLDIKQAYGTVCSASCPAKIVLATDNNQKALAALSK